MIWCARCGEKVEMAVVERDRSLPGDRIRARCHGEMQDYLITDRDLEAIASWGGFQLEMFRPGDYRVAEDSHGGVLGAGPIEGHPGPR